MADESASNSQTKLELSEHARRISYFMLVRLVMLAGFTVLVGVVSYSRNDALSTIHASAAWLTVSAGFVLTIVFARALPRVRDLDAFASVQTLTDLLFSAAAVYMSGGVDSGFVTLYLISVLGASIMGGPRQTWYAAAFATFLYAGGAALETTSVLPPLTLEGYVPLQTRELALSVTRTIGAIVGVTVLSSYLNRQLSTSVLRLDKLRLLNEHIVRSISSGLITVDMDQRVLYFNPMARTLLDLDDDDIGRSLQTLIPDCTLEEAGIEGRQELVVHTRGSRSVRIGLSIAPLTDADDHRLGHVVNFQDLTKLHELSLQVRRNDRLAAVGGLAASVAHEIRNPLAAISGSAELLGTAELGEEDARLLRVIRRESTRLSHLITDMLSFTRPRPPQRRRTSLQQSVREACEAFRADPTSAGVEVVVDIESANDPCVFVDPAQLAQVLWNLARNAGQAMGGAGTLTMRLRQDEDGANIEVSDTGPGIDPEHLEHVFDPFFTTKESGTGFGLAIVHRMVEDNAGTISCASSDHGASFMIRFDLLDLDDHPEDSGVLDWDLSSSSQAEIARIRT